MSRSYYKNEAWLKRQYVYDNKTAAQIANICDTSEMTISRWLKKFGLKRNPRSYSRD